MEDLSIEPGAHAWKICMAIVCLSFDGNLADAALVAATAALMCLKLPRTQCLEDELFVTDGEFRLVNTELAHSDILRVHVAACFGICWIKHSWETI